METLSGDKLEVGGKRQSHSLRKVGTMIFAQ